MKNLFVAGVICFALIVVSSCSKSSELGIGIFSGQQLDALFTDTLSFSILSESNDSILMYNYGSTPFDSLLVGKVNDSVFGLTQSQLFFKPLGSGVPNLSTAKFDSIVMVMAYTSQSSYGDTTDLQTMELYRLTEDMANTDVIYSNKSFAAESTPLSRVSFMPTPNTTVVKYSKDTAASTGFDTSYLKPQLRFNIDKNGSFAQALKQLSFSSTDSTYIDSTFNNWVNGFTVCAKRTSKCFVSFNLTNTNVSTGGNSGLFVYYKNDGDTTARSFQVATGSISPRSTYFTSEIKKSIAGKYLNSTAASGDFLVLQGMSGPNIKFEIPYLNNWKNGRKIAINKAEIEFTVRTTNVQSELFPPIPQILNRKASAALTADYSDNSSLSLSSNPYFYSAGNLYTATVGDNPNVVKQKVNLSHQLQRIIDGLDGPLLYITPNQKQINASRSIYYGTKSGLFRPKLSITYTVLK